MTSIDLSKASFKDFENNPGMDFNARAAAFQRYIADWSGRGHWNYRQEISSPAGPELALALPGNPNKTFVSMVSSDYLGFSRHPDVIQAAISGMENYGTGSGASPAIGGHFTFHREIEQSIAAFFNRDAAMLFTTGYTANSATFQALLRTEDLAILDMAVHASIYEGCQLTNVRAFPHNNMEKLERILQETQGKYRSRVIIVDGVYSQPADMARLDEIVRLAKHYGAYTAMDDAHGVGVIGATGRGVIEHFDLYREIDIITGTFSKTFGHLGGYVVASAELIAYLQYQARQHIFSVTAPPSSCCILKSIELIDTEPHWKEQLWKNISRLNKGLSVLKLDTGNTQSAIIPVITGDPGINAEACRLLLQAGIYATQIGYPAVARKNARIRMSVTAIHTAEQIDRVLNAWEWVAKNLGIRQKTHGNTEEKA